LLQEGTDMKKQVADFAYKLGYHKGYERGSGHLDNGYDVEEHAASIAHTFLEIQNKYPYIYEQLTSLITT
jgi:hypothetical protein